MSIEYLRKLVELKNKLKEKKHQIIKEPLPREDKLTKDDLLFKSNLELKAQLNQVSKNVEGVKKITPLKGPSKEMVKDFINKQNQPVKINDTLYKYHPITAPKKNTQDIEELTQKENDVLAELDQLEADRIKINDSIKQLTSRNNLNNIAIRQKEEKLYTLMNYANKIANGEILFIEEITELIDISRAYGEIDYTDIDNRFENINNIIQQITDEITGHKEQTAEIETELKQLITDYNDLYSAEDNLKHQYLSVNSDKKVLENNYKKEIENYEQTLRRLNSNLIITKEPDETEEEYILRLQQLGEQPLYDPTTDNRAQLYNLEIFKNNLKELTNDESKIEEVYNYFNMMNPGNIFSFNKIFPLFKETYTKLYGINNRSIKAGDMINYITSFLQNQNLPVYNEEAIIPYSFPSSVPPSNILSTSSEIVEFSQPFIGEPIIEEPEEEEIQQTPNRYEAQLRNEYGVFNFYFQPLYISSDGIKQKGFYRLFKNENFLISFCKLYRLQTSEFTTSGEHDNSVLFYSMDYDGKLESWNSLTAQTNNGNARITTVLRDKLGQDIYNELCQALQISSTSDTGLRDELLKIVKYPYRKTFSRYFKKKDVGNNTYYGFGIKKRNKPKEEYIKFGKINISPDKLKYKNILSIQNNKRLKIAGLKNKIVSNKLSEVILKILNNEQPNFKDINDLEEEEKLLLDNILYLSGLHKNIGTGINSTDKFKKKLEVIVGEIEAGNNNDKIKTDLYEVLFKLVHLGAIGEREARRYYKEILNNYF
jgi:hypothetical protein